MVTPRAVGKKDVCLRVATIQSRKLAWLTLEPFARADPAISFHTVGSCLSESPPDRKSPGRLSHLPQNLFARNSPIHHPHAFCFSIGLLDLVQKIAERAAITGIALHHFVGQRETIGGDHQRNHHLQTVRPFIATVSVPGFGVFSIAPSKYVLVRSSLGISRSSGNKLRFAYSCCSSSNTNSVLRHAACAGR